MLFKLVFAVFLFYTIPLFAQNESTVKLIRFSSSHTSFPDLARAAGHTYDKILYTAAEHYSDSSILVAVPSQIKVGKHIDIIFWFHGWRNNIDSAASNFELIEQFLASHRNAILVLPETTKNAPDSYGGKLEQQNTFKLLLRDIISKLKKQKIISRKTKPGNIVLAGHSGAFRVMAYILQNGGEEVKQVVLFDGLYSQVDKYTAWIQADTSHRFINLYTNKGGGTDEVSATMMKGLGEKNIAFINPEEKDTNGTMLKTNQVIFIYSLKEHNDVMNRPDQNFRLFLENSLALKPVFYSIK